MTPQYEVLFHRNNQHIGITQLNTFEEASDYFIHCMRKYYTERKFLVNLDSAYCISTFDTESHGFTIILAGYLDADKKKVVNFRLTDLLERLDKATTNK